MLGHHTYHIYKDTSRKKLPLNFPITTNDITNTDSMFGPDLSGVRGNKKRKKQSWVEMG